MPNPSIKILIVEDEMLIGAKISVFLTELGFEVTGIIPRAEEVTHHIEQNRPDIILLDIQLKGSMDGVQVASIIDEKYHVPVIFLTANADDATFRRAKASKPFAFLTKPFRKIDLQRALELTIERMSTANEVAKELSATDNERDRLNDRIFVYEKDRKVKIMLDDILYVEAERNYCRIVTRLKDHLLTMPMKSLEAQLPTAMFQRIHRSHIVNLQHVDEMDDHVVVVSGKHLALGKSYKKAFYNRINSV